MDEKDIWLSEDEDEVDQELESSTSPKNFNLSLNYQGGGQLGGYHVRNKGGEIQRAVVSSFYGGTRKKHAFTVACEAKAMIHGHMSPESTKRATLLVYGFKFISRRATRIKDADINFEFKPLSTPPGSLGPSVCDVRPKGERRMEETIQKEASRLSLAFNIGPSIPGVDAGLTLSGERMKSKDFKYHTTVTGDNPADVEWGGRFHAHFTLAENRSQKTGIPTEFTVVILVERDNDDDFEMFPQIRVTPDFKTMMVSLASSRPRDEPIHFSVKEPAFNELGLRTSIDEDNLGGTDLDSLWDCTMYTLYVKAEPEAEAAR
ncbi:hypothetical protein VMCG_10054 [Cytospora schulzeri]|uniref:Uncharacterized protein n=1 Tax=Cytospora schulzeri TaxID=448051 RepID=A0A423VD50_9PEZI|nr:hypothetical protein VMCG_10054 [Valsa malicola]